MAERDPAVKVIVLRGAGRWFSGGYDFGGGDEHRRTLGSGQGLRHGHLARDLDRRTAPFEQLEARVAEVAAGLCRIPLSQLQAQKLIVNQAYENMGLSSTQTLGGILDGLMRNTPEALDFVGTAADDGVRAAIERRDGPFGDYSQAPPELRPNPSRIMTP